MRKLAELFVLISILLAACTPTSTASTGSPAAEDATQVPAILTVYTHDSFDVSEAVIQEFQEQNHVEVRFLAGGDTGSALNKLILSKGNPPADVFYGVDNTFLSRALSEDIFIPYASPLLDEIPDQYELDPEHRALPVDFGDVCINYGRGYFQDKNLAVPTSLEDLLKPAYQGLLVVENPATSSPGLAFLLTTIAEYGDPGYLNYWQKLVENGVKIVNDWETAYYGEFSQGDGQHPMVVSYGSSPPFEVIYAETPIEEPPTGAIVSDGTCFRQIEFVGILRGTKNEALAQKWIDFMLAPTFQEDMPLRMFVFPVNPQAKLDETFQKYLAIPQNPAELNLETIAQNRETWIQAWTDTVLR